MLQTIIHMLSKTTSFFRKYITFETVTFFLLFILILDAVIGRQLELLQYKEIIKNQETKIFLLEDKIYDLEKQHR